MSQKKRKTYSVSFKLSAVEFAETNSNIKAAEHFEVNISQILRWKSTKDSMLLVQNKNKKCVFKFRPAKWPALEAHLKSWLVEKRKEGHCVSARAILREARLHALRMEIPDFKGSASWICRFMKRNKLTKRAVTSVGQHLPDDWENKMSDFIEYVNNHKDGYDLDHIANMDEVPVCFDLPSKFTIDQIGSSDIRVTTTGAEKARFTVVLCVTASCKKLPAYVIFKRKTLPKGKFPQNIIVSANETSSMTAAETVLWQNKVWIKRPNSLFDRRSLLMLDSAPGHKTAEVKAKFRENGTTLAMIPGGLTKKLQVLDISVNKSFKSRLRNKWEQWMINGFKEYTKSGRIKRASYEEICKWISQSWEEVPDSAIKNGFVKTTINFYCNENNVIENEEDWEVEYLLDDEDDIQEKLMDIFLDEENFGSDLEEDYE